MDVILEDDAPSTPAIVLDDGPDDIVVRLAPEGHYVTRVRDARENAPEHSNHDRVERRNRGEPRRDGARVPA